MKTRRSLTFPTGLVGLPELRRFELTLPSREGPLGWLQSLEEPAIGFAVADPFWFKPGYEVHLSEAEVQRLGLGGDPPLVLVIVRIPEDPAAMTANLVGPLLINPATGAGCQVVLEDTSYNLRESLLSPVPARSLC